jgi:uncharacterized Tic20 family protein
MCGTPLTVLTEPSPDERTMATLAHVLQLVGWWIAPLIIFLLKRESRFVSFHALQALLLQILYMIVMGVFMIFWFATFFATIHNTSGPHAAPRPAFFILFPLIWVGFMGLWVAMLVIAIIYGIKAGRGEWASYPVLGALASRILKIDANGQQIPA